MAMNAKLFMMEKLSLQGIKIPPATFGCSQSSQSTRRKPPMMLRIIHYSAPV